jgi:hypothetical protein
MRTLILSAAIAAIALGSLPASAQVEIREGGDRDRVVVREHDEGRHEGWRHEGWRRHHAECGVVRVKTRLPNGNVIIKTRRSC